MRPEPKYPAARAVPRWYADRPGHDGYRQQHSNSGFRRQQHLHVGAGLRLRSSLVADYKLQQHRYCHHARLIRQLRHHFERTCHRTAGVIHLHGKKKSRKCQGRLVTRHLFYPVSPKIEQKGLPLVIRTQQNILFKEANS